MFNTISHLGYLDGNSSRILDVFSGAGSVGLEALSRGASFATFVDFSRECIETSCRNALKCKFQHQISSICSKAEDVFANPPKYEHYLHAPYQIVTMTPPYREVSYPLLMDTLCASSLIEPDSLIVVEYPLEMGTMPFFWGKQQEWIGLRNRRYGRTVIAMYVNRPTMTFDFREDEFRTEAITPKKPY